MSQIDVEIPGGRVRGSCDARFESVAHEFERSFRERGEIGASVCLTLEGETLVDLWGGRADPKSGRAWERDSMCVVFSCTKGAVALCAHLLASRGELDLDAPVKQYWPEFAQAGKAAASVRMLLNHTVGVPALREPVRPGGFCDFDYMADRLAAEAPFWEPGTRQGYHLITFGWTVGEIVRRVSGRPLGAFFREEIAGPLGLDFWIGLPEEEEPRVAPLLPFSPEAGSPPSSFFQALFRDRQSIQALALFNTGGFDPNDRAHRAAPIGGAGGVANARALAGMYAPLACGGGRGGVTLVDAESLARMGHVSSATDEDATLLVSARIALGFMKSIDNRRRRRAGDRHSALFGHSAFGHAGAGGSIGFADPEARMSFGYAMNRMGEGILLNERGQSLIDAAYRALGYRSNASGAWVR